MKSVLRIALCATALTLSASVAGAFPTVSSPGKNVAAATTVGVTLTNGFAPAQSVQLLKGKKKHIVKVEATMVENTNAATVLAGNVFINGVQIDPGTVQLTEGCTVTFLYCSFQGTWWADIDALELANPGMFVGLPLDIRFDGIKQTTPSTTAVTATISVFAQQMRK